MDKLGYILIIAGAILIAFKQSIDTVISGDWTYPGMMRVQGVGVLIIAIGAVCVIKAFLDTRKKDK